MLITAALLATVAAVSPESAPEVFEISMNGVVVGAEEFHRTESPDGLALSGKVSLKIPGVGDVAFAQDAKLARDGHPVSYTLDVDAPGQAAVVRVVATPAGYMMSVTSKGAPARSQAVEGRASVHLLDNNLASHFDALTRGLTDLGRGEQRTITALVPQAMAALEATVERGDDGAGSQDDVVVTTRSYRLSLANVSTELTVRDADGALLQVAVPLQKALLRRRGFEPAPASAATPKIPPDPRETSTEVRGPGVALRATLLIPSSESPVPAVVFLSGSGPNDRDGTIGPNRPLEDIARGLGDRGIASLRFDKRTLAIKDASEATAILLKDEYYDDAKAAIAQVAALPKIDAKRVFIVGHSEGAMVAPVVASAAKPTRGIVMLAPGVRPADEVVLEQFAFGAKLTGLSDADIADQRKLLADKFKAIRDKSRTHTPPFMGASAAYWRELLALDVPKSVRESPLPILVLQGDKDFQVRKDLDFELLRSRAGTAGGRVVYRSFPDLNHYFMKVAHESTGAEYAVPAHVDPDVIAAVADWILAR